MQTLPGLGTVLMQILHGLVNRSRKEGGFATRTSRASLTTRFDHPHLFCNISGLTIICEKTNPGHSWYRFKYLPGTNRARISQPLWERGGGCATRTSRASLITRFDYPRPFFRSGLTTDLSSPPDTNPARFRYRPDTNPARISQPL